MTTDDLTRLAKIFKALGDETRLSMLAAARNREVECTCGDACCPEVATVSELADQCAVSLPTVSYHLKELVAAGLIVAERRGRRAFCRVDPDGLLAAAGFLESITSPIEATSSGGRR